jgi:hypothetical protein
MSIQKTGKPNTMGAAPKGAYPMDHFFQLIMLHEGSLNAWKALHAGSTELQPTAKTRLSDERARILRGQVNKKGVSK